MAKSLNKYTFLFSLTTSLFGKLNNLYSLTENIVKMINPG
jgi:hypothetical protein